MTNQLLWERCILSFKNFKVLVQVETLNNDPPPQKKLDEIVLLHAKDLIPRDLSNIEIKNIAYRESIGVSPIVSRKDYNKLLTILKE